jgi:hypothetical protein
MVNWITDSVFFKLIVLSAIYSSLVFFLLFLGSYQGFQEETMKALLRTLLLISWLGTGTSFTFFIVPPINNRRKENPIVLMCLLSFFLWTALAMAWEVWIYA